MFQMSLSSWPRTLLTWLAAALLAFVGYGSVALSEPARGSSSSHFGMTQLPHSDPAVVGGNRWQLHVPTSSAPSRSASPMEITATFRSWATGMATASTHPASYAPTPGTCATPTPEEWPTSRSATATRATPGGRCLGRRPGRHARRRAWQQLVPAQLPDHWDPRRLVGLRQRRRLPAELEPLLSCFHAARLQIPSPHTCDRRTPRRGAGR